MRAGIGQGRAGGVSRDWGAIRRYLWLPVAAVAVAVAVALITGALWPTSGDARFRSTVLVDALPPLFGPAVLPSPFDYAKLATSDPVLRGVAQRTGVTTAQLRPRLSAQAQFNRAEIEFRVTGAGALGIARAWQQAFADAAAQQTPALERLLAAPYARQLDEARAQLEQQARAAAASPGDPAAQQQLKAAEANYETASQLSQSYEVVARTMTAQAVFPIPAREERTGLGSTPGRLGAAVAVGLLAGVLGALALDVAARRRGATSSPEPIDARPAFRARGAGGGRSADDG